MMEVGQMPRKRITPEEIIHKLREAEILVSQGRTVAEQEFRRMPPNRSA